MPMEIHIPMKVHEDGVPCNSMLLLPHEVFEAFFALMHGNKFFYQMKKSFRSFWDDFQGHPCFQNHPLQSMPNYKDKVIPLGFHGDECPVLGVGKIWCKCVLFFIPGSLRCQLLLGKAINMRTHICLGCV